MESTDLAVYAANLRAAGCPPKTVRDILLPWLEDNFEQPPAAEPTNFWASFGQRQAAAAVQAKQETDLEQQKDKMLRELFGFAWTSEGIKLAYSGEAAGPVGFLDYERAEKLLCITDRFKKQFSRTNSRRTDRLSAIYQAWQREAGEILSPSELEETELREILMIYQRRNPDFRNIGLSGSELRQLMAFRRDLCNPLSSALFAKNDEPLPEPNWGSEKQFNAKVRSLLGDDRFIDYLNNFDTGIKMTLAALEKEHLPRNFALQLFDFRQEAMTQAQEIRQQPVRRAEKRRQLAALHQSALEQLAALPHAATNNFFLEIRDWLPEDTKQKPSADSPLLEINRNWLQEIANP